MPRCPVDLLRAMPVGDAEPALKITPEAPPTLGPATPADSSELGVQAAPLDVEPAPAVAAANLAATQTAPDYVVIWHVVGGGDKGGIIVRAGKDLNSYQELQRLSTGALVEQITLEGDRLCYTRLTGTGPKSGWVSTKISNKELLKMTDKRLRPQGTGSDVGKDVTGNSVQAPSTPSAVGKSSSAGSVKQAVPKTQTATTTLDDILHLTKKKEPRESTSATAKKAAAHKVVPPSGDMVAQVQYLKYDGVYPFVYMYQREDGGEQTHATFEYKEVPMTDGRPTATSFSLDVQGFLLVPHRTALSAYDFYERPHRIWGEYYAEMRELLKKVTGASKVAIFDHNIRNPREMKWRRGVIGYVPYAHNDYTTASGPQRVRDMARPADRMDTDTISEDEVDELLKGRYVCINVWRNIAETPVAADPLAVADGRSFSDDHCVPTDLVYRDRSGQTYSLTHDPAHKWYYFSGMPKDEALLLKCYDSVERPGSVRWSAHTGFVDPRSPPDAPVRESIDARCLCFFRDGDEDRTLRTCAELFPDFKP